MLSVAVGFGVKSGVKNGPLSVVGWGGAQTWSAHPRNTWLAGKGSAVRIRHAPPQNQSQQPAERRVFLCQLSWGALKKGTQSESAEDHDRCQHRATQRPAG